MKGRQRRSAVETALDGVQVQRQQPKRRSFVELPARPRRNEGVMRALFNLAGIGFGICLGYNGARLLAVSIAGDDGFLAATIFLTAGLLYLVIAPVCGMFCARRFLPHLQSLPQNRRWFLTINTVVSMIALIGGLRQITAECAALPSDKSMIDNFERHRVVFDRVIHMALTEKQVRQVTENYPDERALWDTDLSEMRLRKYRDLFAEAGLRHGFFRTGSAQETLFRCWRAGWPLSENGRDQSKGYAYLPKPPDALSPDLDRFSDRRDWASRAYRRLDGNWYLYYDVIEN